MLSAVMYFSVKRTWLFSQTARRVYLLCAILDLALFGTEIAVQAAIKVSGVSYLGSLTRILLELILVPEVIGTAVLIVGMTYCWLMVGGSCGRKLVWILYMPWFLITMPAYYFAVYRRLALELSEEVSTVGLATAEVR